MSLTRHCKHQITRRLSCDISFFSDCICTLNVNVLFQYSSFIYLHVHVHVLSYIKQCIMWCTFAIQYNHTIQCKTEMLKPANISTQLRNIKSELNCVEPNLYFFFVLLRKPSCVCLIHITEIGDFFFKPG